MPVHLAHMKIKDGVTAEQTLSEHVRAVAEYASDKLRSVGLYKTAYLAGLVHDMGKAAEKYQTYLRKSAKGESVIRGSVNHTYCGVIYLMERYARADSGDLQVLACEIIAYAAGAHHGQFDCIGLDEKSGFRYRLDKDRDDISCDEAKSNFIAECAGEDELDALYADACEEIRIFYEGICGYGKESQRCFCTGLCARLVLSAVIDGDRRDSAEFETGASEKYITADKAMWERELAALEAKLDGFKDKDTLINRARRKFSDACRTFADKEGGIYRVNIPTGGGKTLSALRYALAHAGAHDKKRIIFVIPLLTIIEQNSKAIKDVLTDPSIMIEHHSNVVRQAKTGDELERYELLAQTWESPIVITTLVQLLNTLFAGSNTDVRRMSSLCGSVIIIDEVQSLPKKVIDMFNSAMNFLAYSCGATVILSSATHPRFDIVKRSLKYSENADIIPYDETLFSVFKRTNIINKTTPIGRSVEELACFAGEIIEKSSSLLIVCNTKKTAKQLFSLAKHYRSDKCEVCHLSTSMCMKHRQDTLKKIYASLGDRCNGRKVICVSTQLIEAGVDISFNSAIRVVAGLDNIIQVAGRCNRSGEYGGICDVYIVNLKSDNKDLSNLPDIADAARITRGLLDNYEDDPEQYNNDLASYECIDDFYRYLYNDENVKKQFSYPFESSNGEERLYSMLADNKKYTKNTVRRYHLNQAFKTAGDAFKVFDEETFDVIVPYDEDAKIVISELCGERAKHDLMYLRDLLNSAKPYTVSLFKHQYEQFDENGLLYRDDDKGFSVLSNENYYDADTGITIDADLYY